eukprot:TRINITY_DN1320_c1_g1_i1.p1 TRINITY_DN1320_c1_g1~~TRINITY_DN1320_c1_g1_i1.p1  ORF type:complete len:799 (+),score=323.56 TRINITY_DN1320_c1_g1_i1:143-2539(+)
MAAGQWPPRTGGAPGEEDELYGGFSSTGAAASGVNQQGFAGPTAFGGTLGGNPLRPPPSSQGQWAGNWGAAPQSGMQGSMMGGTVDQRPMTSNRASGYQAQPRSVVGQLGGFDPLKQGHMMSQAPPLQKRSENSPEEQCLEIEKKVNALIEESAMLALQKDYPLSLEKAIEAGKKERWLCREREKLGLGDQINIDLTYSVHFNLAVQYHNNQCYTEALNTYSMIVRNKQYAQSGRLRVNMGNIYAEQKKYNYAIKMYKLALEQVPQTGKELRYKITRNIANAFVHMGNYQDAITNYEAIMKENPDIQTGFNLLLCFYVLRNQEKLKRHFLKMLQVRMYGSTDDEDDDEGAEGGDDRETVFLDDGLNRELRDRRKQHAGFILTAGRLIAPMIESDWEKGFEFVVGSLKQHRVTELKDSTSRLASEMEMCWALQYLKHKKYSKAIERLKAFEKKDKQLKAKSACNLSYLYFLESDYENGEKYADMSVEADKYNAKALVNKGNFLYVRGEYDKAKEYYLGALRVEADCWEALYNLGLATKALQQFKESLTVYTRLFSMLDAVEVVYQLANLNDLLDETGKSVEWFNRLITRVPTDPSVLARLGTIHAKKGDESQAFHYHLEAYRYFPVNMDVISWLGAYFVKNEVYEKAMRYFDRASQIQPTEVKWRLMVASCHRRIGAFPSAKRMYEDIHRKNPDNAECLRYLVHLCNEMGLKDDAVEYHKKLMKLDTWQESGGQYSGYSEEGAGEEAGQEAQQKATATAGRRAEPQPAAEPPAAAAAPKPAKKQEEEDELDLQHDLPGI